MPRELSPDEFDSKFGGGRFGQPMPAGWSDRFGAAVDRAQGQLYGVGEALTGSETLGRLRRENLADAELNRARAARDTNTPDSFREVDGAGSFGRFAAGLLVDSSPEILTSLAAWPVGAAAGLSTAGRLALGAAAKYPSALGDILQNQREEAGATNVGTAAALAVPYAAVDMLGLEGALASGRFLRSGVKALDNLQGVRGAAARAGATALRTAPVEGGTETFQEGMNQLGRMTVNPAQTLFNPEANERYAESFVGGAVLGGVLSPVMGGARRSEHYAPPRPAPMEPPADAAEPPLTPPAVPQAPRAPAAELELPSVVQQVMQEQADAHEAAQEQAAQAAADPAVQRVQAIKERAAQVAQEQAASTARAGEFGITKSAAVATYADLEALHTDGVLDDEQFASAAGRLAGEATGLGSVRKEIAALRRQIEADARAAQLEREQTERLAAADAAQRDADIAKLQENARAAQAAKAQPPAAPNEKAGAAPTAGRAADAAPTSAAVERGAADVQAAGVAPAPAGAGVAADKTATVGRTGREVQVTPQQWVERLQGATPQERQRVLDLLGAEMTEDPTTGETRMVLTDNPRTTAEVADLETQRTGRPVSRVAVHHTAAKFGLSEDVVNRATGAGADTVTDAELGLQQGEDGDATSGMRTEGTLSKAAGQGLVEGDAETARQRAMRLEADRLLQDAGVSDSRIDDNPVSPEQASTAALHSRNEQVKRDNVRALLAHDEATAAAADWDQPGADWADLPDSIKADAVEAYLRNLHNNDGELDFQEWARDTGAIYEDFQRWQANNARRLPAGAQTDRAGAAGATRGAQAGAADAGTAGRGAASVEQAPTVVGDGSKSTATVSRKKRRTVERPVQEASALRSPGAAYTLQTTDGPVRVVPTTLQSLYDENPGFARTIDALRAAGQQHVIDTVQDWGVATADGWDGVFTTIDGRRTILLNARIMHSQGDIGFTTRHELSHAADLLEAGKGGVFSRLPDMHLRRGADGRVRPLGDVVAELVDHYENENTALSELLQYPLDPQAYRGMSETETREELFAQVHAFYSTKLGRSIITTQLPDTAAFLEQVNAQIQTDAYRKAAKAAAPDGGVAAPRVGPVRASQSPAVSPGAGRPDAPAARGVRAGLTPAGIRYSRSAARPAPATLPAPAQRLEGAVGGLLRTLKDAATWTVHRGAFTEDLARMAERVLPSAAEYIRQARAVAVERQKAEREIDAILQGYADLRPHEKGTGPGSVNAFLKASTMAREWGYDSGIKGAKFDPQSKLAAQFKALSTPAQNLVRQVFQHGHDNLLRMQAAVRDTANGEYGALIEAAEAAGDKAEAAQLAKRRDAALERYEKLLAMNSSWPYAPLKRFGSHVVVGMSQAYADAKERGDMQALEKLEGDPAHYFVAFRETKREARALAAQIAPGFHYADHFQRDEAQQQLYGGRDPLGAFQRMRQLVGDSQDDRLKGAAGRALDTLLADLHLTLLSEHSVRQSERTRAGVAGAEDDMMRAFATRGRAQAHFIASLESQGAVQDALHAMRDDADRLAPGRSERREFYNELLRRHVMGMDYQASPAVEKIMGASSVWMLLTSPAHFLVNATQPWTMTLPTMAGRHGYARSSAALARAYRDIFPLVKDGTITEDDYSRLPSDVRADIEELANRGRIDISLSQDLGRWRSEGGRSPDQLLGTAVNKLRGVAQTVESINRMTTAIAALRLERERSTQPGAALEYADRLIYDTHGDYSGFNSPRLMRNPVGRVATQFRKFQLIQLSLFARLTHQAFKGASANERFVARKALAFNLGTMFALGGLLGMPGAQAIGWVLRQAFGDDDEPDNPELTLRRLVGGGELADLLTKGVPNALGLDVSGRVGAGGMLSLLPYADLEATRKGYESAAVAAMGPFLGGILPNAVDGVGLIGRGQYWQGLEKLLLPKGFADMSKAVRYQTSGITDRRGEVLMGADDLTVLASLSQAVGLPSASLTQRQARASAAFTSDKHFKERTTSVKAQYIQAYRDNDVQGLQEAREAWAALQDARSRNGFTRQPLSELLKAPRQRAREQAQVVDGVRYRSTGAGMAALWD